jgi:hypothetical protein
MVTEAVTREGSLESKECALGRSRRWMWPFGWLSMNAAEGLFHVKGGHGAAVYDERAARARAHLTLHLDLLELHELLR